MAKPILRNCETCNKVFLLKEFRNTRPLQKFCSVKCIRNDTQFDGSDAGEKHYEWRGDEASYSSKHKWMRKVLGKPGECSYCGKENIPGKDGRSTIQWANIDHQYTREPADYIPLCYSCHALYDQKLRTNS